MYKIFNQNIMDKIDVKLYFDPTGVHGVMHVYRVLRLILWIGTLEKLTENEMTILFYSALYHDIGRTNNLVDDTHGIKSYKKIINKGLLNNIKNLESTDIEIMKFIIEEHAVKDEIGKKNIINYSIKDKDKALKLYEVFKDADGLDRVRIGDLNIKYLRRKYSKVLVTDAERLYKEFPNCSYKEIFKSIKRRLINKGITKESLGIKDYSVLDSILFSKVNDCNMIYNPDIEECKCNNEYFKSIVDSINNMDSKPICKDVRDYIFWMKKYFVPIGLANIKIKDNSISIIPRNNVNGSIKIEKSKCGNNYFKSIVDGVNNIDSIPISGISDLKDHVLFLKEYMANIGLMDIKIKDNSISIIFHNGEFLIYPVEKKNYHLFHGTNIEGAKKITKDGYIKATKKDKFDTAYNKVFLSNSTKYSALYSMCGGSSNILSVLSNKEPNEYSIVFQINTSKCDIYHYYTFGIDCEEYFVWNNISVEEIEKCYLMKYCDIVREIDVNKLKDLQYKDIIKLNKGDL